MVDEHCFCATALIIGIETVSEFGYLYDVIVDILPTPQSSILQIIGRQEVPAYVQFLILIKGASV